MREQTHRSVVRSWLPNAARSSKRPISRSSFIVRFMELGVDSAVLPTGPGEMTPCLYSTTLASSMKMNDHGGLPSSPGVPGDERSQDASSSGSYAILMVYTVPGAASPQRKLRKGSQWYWGSVPRCESAVCSSTQWAERTSPSGSCGLSWPTTSHAK
jgi:hypothetical protein